MIDDALFAAVSTGFAVADVALARRALEAALRGDARRTLFAPAQLGDVSEGRHIGGQQALPSVDTLRAVRTIVIAYYARRGSDA